MVFFLFKDIVLLVFLLPLFSVAVLRNCEKQVDIVLRKCENYRRITKRDCEAAKCLNEKSIRKY